MPTLRGYGGGGGGGGAQTGSGSSGGGAGGFGAGSGGAGGVTGASGNGGDGYGGAIFVRQGGTLTVQDSSASGSTVAAGSGHTAGVTDGAGTLAGNTDSLQGNITNNGQVAFSQNTSGAYAGNITGSGSVSLVGSGVVTLTGVNNYSGSTNVNGGTLVVDGSVGATAVNSGGALIGEGTLGATTVNAGGMIYPGTVGAPLTINGNFTQATGSTYTAEVSPKASDKIIVNGAAQIASGATLGLVVDPGSYRAGTTYTLLEATGGVTGTYSTTILPSPGSGIAFSVVYEPDEIDLIIKSLSTHFAVYAQTQNQFAVATAIDLSSNSPTGDYATVISQLQTLSSSQLPGALNQLAGDIYPSIGAIELQTTTAWMQLLSNRLAQQLRPVAIGGTAEEVSVAGEKYDAEVKLVSYQDSDGSVRTAPRLIIRQTSYVPRWTVWSQSYGLGGSVSGNGNAGGLNYGLGGTLVGIDRWLDDTTLVGVMGGYAGTSLGDRLDSDHASINGGQVGLYELNRRGRLYISNVDAFSGDNYRVTRPIDFGTISRSATGASFGNQWAHYTEAGRTLGRGRLRLQPFTGLQYIYLAQRGTNETGANSIDMITSSQHINRVRGSFGGRIYSETVWHGIRMIPSASARYQHEWGSGTQLISSSFAGAPTTSFVTAGNYLGRDFGLFTLSSTAVLTERASLFGALDSQVSSNYNAVMGSGGFQYRW